MINVEYNQLIQQILHDYKSVFEIDVNIVCDTREQLLKIEPTLIMRENTAAVYHNKSKTIFINKEVLEKIAIKNFNNDNNKYDNSLAFLVHACFHELEHRIQSERPELLVNQKTIYPIMYKLEQFLISIYQYEQKYDDYAKIHDRFISEIDADIKGNRNLKAFAGKYNLPVNPDYIELFNTYNIFRENNYEPLFFINQFNKNIKEHPEIFRIYKRDSTFINNRIKEFNNDNSK